MFIINLIKVGLIWLTDILNKLNDPFEEFTRSMHVPYVETLATKAAKFEEDFKAFRLRNDTVYSYRIPISLGDQSLWHGVATTMFALKGDLVAVKKCLIGMAAQQPDGRLIRGIDEQGLWRDDASNDQASGHLLGLYMAWKYGDVEIRSTVKGLITEWASNILQHNHALVDVNEHPTTYGQLIDGWKTDPLRLTLCLAIYAFASKVTDGLPFANALHSMYAKYRNLVPYAKVKLWWKDTVYDTHRAAIHYYILSDIFPEDKYVQKGIKRLGRITHKQGNVWVDLLLQKCEKSTLTKVLSEFTLEDKQYNTGKMNSPNEPNKIQWGGEWMSKQPWPRWLVASQDFFWQRNLYTLDWGTNGSPSDSRHNGLDYLIVYYWGLRNGLLEKGD